MNKNFKLSGTVMDSFQVKFYIMLTKIQRELNQDNVIFFFVHKLKLNAKGLQEQCSILEFRIKTFIVS